MPLAKRRPGRRCALFARVADTTDAEEINEVAIVREAWTCERHRATDGSTSDAHHTSGHGLSLGWAQSTDEQWTERVVILSPVPGVSYE